MIENLIFIIIFIILFVSFGFLYSEFKLNRYRKIKKEKISRLKHIIESNSFPTDIYYAGCLSNSDMSIQNIKSYLKLTNSINTTHCGK